MINEQRNCWKFKKKVWNVNRKRSLLKPDRNYVAHTSRHRNATKKWDTIKLSYVIQLWCIHVHKCANEIYAPLDLSYSSTKETNIHKQMIWSKRRKKRVKYFVYFPFHFNHRFRVALRPRMPRVWSFNKCIDFMTRNMPTCLTRCGTFKAHGSAMICFHTNYFPFPKGNTTLTTTA